jgi:hypothetical protein
MRACIVPFIAAVLTFFSPEPAHAAEPSDLATDAQRQQADQAFTDAERSLTVRLLDRAKAATDADAALLADLKVRLKAFSERLNGLRTNEDGKRLAATLNEVSAVQVRRLLANPPGGESQIAATERELVAVTGELKRLKDNPPAGFTPPEQEQEELAKIGVSLRQSIGQVSEQAKWLDSVMTTAPKGFDASKAPTLDAVLSDFQRREEQAWNAAQRTGIEQAKPEAMKSVSDAARVAKLERSLERSQELLRQAREENEEARVNLDMRLRSMHDAKDREVAELNMKIANSQAQAAVTNAKAVATVERGSSDAEKIRLIQKCEDAEVKRLFAPFTSAGLWQPGDRQNHPFLHDRGPVSLSALSKCGALRPTPEGLTKLYICGNGSYLNWNYQQHPDTERPKWGYDRTPSQLSQRDWQELKHAQDLLNELGATMVEQKMLAP